jgi:DNA-binding PadR family transcriptional regulator
MITRKVLLGTLIKHETLTINDICKEENLGMVPNEGQLKYLLQGLTSEGFLQILTGVSPYTYTITTKGIEEGKRLNIG